MPSSCPCPNGSVEMQLPMGLPLAVSGKGEPAWEGKQQAEVRRCLRAPLGRSPVLCLALSALSVHSREIHSPHLGNLLRHWLVTSN